VNRIPKRGEGREEFGVSNQLVEMVQNIRRERIGRF
jgi:hypothetical protein